MGGFDFASGFDDIIGDLFGDFFGTGRSRGGRSRASCTIMSIRCPSSGTGWSATPMRPGSRCSPSSGRVSASPSCWPSTATSTLGTRARKSAEDTFRGKSLRSTSRRSRLIERHGARTILDTDRAERSSTMRTGRASRLAARRARLGAPGTCFDQATGPSPARSPILRRRDLHRRCRARRRHDVPWILDELFGRARLRLRRRRLLSGAQDAAGRHQRARHVAAARWWHEQLASAGRRRPAWRGCSAYGSRGTAACCAPSASIAAAAGCERGGGRGGRLAPGRAGGRVGVWDVALRSTRCASTRAVP